MSKLKIAAGFSLAVAYIILFFYVLLDRNGSEPKDYMLYIFWFFGILNAGTNIYYAIEKSINKWVTILFVITSIIWIFPFLLITYFGIPFLIIYLFIGIYIQLNQVTKINS
ncbi:MAG: hypothetical protein CMP12_01810 [Zunongwangia sp.]|uniref:Uncharacterized protein n=1 Tax=Zunongwangia profunda TaxID=398743 RepID=A0A3D5J1D1_9FLAO|nr:hypothetical protein [Zunongwangia profunda]MAO34644.1 hypothetical protein [Zunongwangia sp.]MAS72081.1 hypothetical protein [Zunongwangia sp.]MBJ98434.1 hypothetical protein [Flavobacteriaceae bacterium]HCV81120.1 hypothetical protein [Zunongwangia profunda]